MLSSSAESFLIASAEKLGLSARGFDRIIRVARTIADLEESTMIHHTHIGEALHFRRISRLSDS